MTNTKHPQSVDTKLHTSAWHLAYATHENLVGYDALFRMLTKAQVASALTPPRLSFHLPLSTPMQLYLTLNSSKFFSHQQVEIQLRFPSNGETLYLGTIDEEGILRASSELRDSDPKLKKAVWSVVHGLRGDNPSWLITKLSKHSGICACCGRELTQPASITRGVGPKCAERFGIPLEPILDLSSL